MNRRLQPALLVAAGRLDLRNEVGNVSGDFALGIYARDVLADLAYESQHVAVLIDPAGILAGTSRIVGVYARDNVALIDDVLASIVLVSMTYQSLDEVEVTGSIELDVYICIRLAVRPVGQVP